MSDDRLGALISEDELAERIGAPNRRTVRKIIEKAGIPRIRLGHKQFVRQAAFDAYVARKLDKAVSG